MPQTVIVITEMDNEYGYDIFVGVASTPEKALEVCIERENREVEPPYPLMLNENRTQVGMSRRGTFYTTLYFLQEIVVRE